MPEPPHPMDDAKRPPSTKLLSMEGIGKSFSGVPVLHDVDFDLEPGEVHILAGENGAGKSTLIKILAGVHAEYAGSVRMGGRRVSFRSPQEAARRGVSVIHQEMSLVGPMSVADNIFLGRERTRAGLWMDDRSQGGRARRLVEELGLDLDLRRPVEQFPISVQQMIEIAKALAFEARIIVMDEPTSALSEPDAERLFEVIGRLKEEGCGIIYITHRMEEIFRIGDRISVLRDGRHIGTAAASDLSREELVRWMIGREIRQQFPDRFGRSEPVRLKVNHFHLRDPSGSRPWLVQDVSLEVRAGEILGVAGLQASGISELLHGLYGAYGGSAEGTVLLDGKPLPIRSPGHSIRRGVALLTNDRKETGLVLGMDIARNVTLASLDRFSPAGWLRRGKEEAAGRRQIETLRIQSPSPRRPVEILSGGNQQKVVLAKWLETDPKVLLLDEPTRGVDVGAKHEIYELMNDWTSRGVAILLITSEILELLAMSDRIAVFHRGRLAAEFPREEATQEKILRAAMGEGLAA